MTWGGVALLKAITLSSSSRISNISLRSATALDFPWVSAKIASAAAEVVIDHLLFARPEYGDNSGSFEEQISCYGSGIETAEKQKHRQVCFCNFNPRFSSPKESSSVLLPQML
jgi:hypothetical protein